MHKQMITWTTKGYTKGDLLSPLTEYGIRFSWMGQKGQVYFRSPRKKPFTADSSIRFTKGKRNPKPKLTRGKYLVALVDELNRKLQQQQYRIRASPNMATNQKLKRFPTIRQSTSRLLMKKVKSRKNCGSQQLTQSSPLTLRTLMIFFYFSQTALLMQTPIEKQQPCRSMIFFMASAASLAISSVFGRSILLQVMCLKMLATTTPTIRKSRLRLYRIRDFRGLRLRRKRFLRREALNFRLFTTGDLSRGMMILELSCPDGLTTSSGSFRIPINASSKLLSCRVTSISSTSSSSLMIPPNFSSSFILSVYLRVVGSNTWHSIATYFPMMASYSFWCFEGPYTVRMYPTPNFFLMNMGLPRTREVPLSITHTRSDRASASSRW